MTVIDIMELLKEHTRQDVRQILVNEGIANDLAHAEFIVAISLGESKGDRIRLDENEFARSFFQIPPCA